MLPISVSNFVILSVKTENKTSITVLGVFITIPLLIDNRSITSDDKNFHSAFLNKLRNSYLHIPPLFKILFSIM